MTYFDNSDSNNFLSTKYPVKLGINGQVFKNINEYVEEMRASAEEEGYDLNLEDILINVNTLKFSQYPNLAIRLMNLEGNIVDTHQDSEYPKNFIGKILVCIRESLRKYKTTTIASWNVNGIRSNILQEGTIKKCSGKSFSINSESNLGKLTQLIHPDIICFQETRCGKDVGECIKVEDYPFRYWNCSKKSGARGSGYSGTAIWSKIQPKNIYYYLPTLPEEQSDLEGRIIIAEFSKFYLINIYVPNSLSNEEYRINVWDPSLLNYLEKLKLEGKKVIVCGDFNVAHNSSDVWFRKTNKRMAGFLPEEREDMNKFLKEYIDIYRKFYPTVDDVYTWWSMKNKMTRELNKGWRLDYFLITPNIEKNIIAANIWRNIQGSDHCPISISLNLKI